MICGPQAQPKMADQAQSPFEVCIGKRQRAPYPVVKAVRRREISTGVQVGRFMRVVAIGILWSLTASGNESRSAPQRLSMHFPGNERADAGLQ
jgi:hypothetical protein